MPPRRNVLILHRGALGDFVLSWPLAAALARLMPQSRIVYVAAASKGALARRALRVESADAEHGWHRLHASEFDPADLPPPTQKLLAGAAAVYDFTGAPAETLSRAVGDGAVPILPLRPQPAEDFRGHHSADLLEQLADRPVVAAGVRAVLEMLGRRGISPRRGGGGPVVIHPGSGSREKCWPTTRFAEVARRLVAAGRDVRVVLGEVEAERMAAAEVEAFADAGAAVERLGDLVGLFEALRDGSLFVGNDSGPTHLAGILGVPTVALFGPTDPTVWRPLGPAVQVVRGEAMEAIPVEAVFEQLEFAKQAGV